VVSGTVFNKVLLWAVGLDRTDKLEVVRVIFRGHEVSLSVGERRGALFVTHLMVPIDGIYGFFHCMCWHRELYFQLS